MRHIVLLRAALTALCVVATATCVPAQQARAVAHVLDVSGQWRLDDSATPVAAGQALAAGAKISAASNRPGDAITIVRDEDMSRQRTACDATAANPCRNPIVVPGTSVSGPSAGSQFMGLVQAAVSVLLSKPPAINTHYALTLTRGNDAVREMEAVVVLDPAQGVMLPPAPDDMPAGMYTLSIARAGEKAAATQTVQLTSEGTWRPMAWNAAGLYEISLANADGEPVVDAMILATTAAQYPAERDAFDAMKSRTAAWTGPGARADEHLFLRAYLLTESQRGSSQP